MKSGVPGFSCWLIDELLNVDDERVILFSLQILSKQLGKKVLLLLSEKAKILDGLASEL